MTEDELDQLIKDAGIGKRTADKLRETLRTRESGQPEEQPKPKGHGAPHDLATLVAEF